MDLEVLNLLWSWQSPCSLKFGLDRQLGRRVWGPDSISRGIAADNRIRAEKFYAIVSPYLCI